MNKVKYWIAVLPSPVCGVFCNKTEFWVDRKMRELVRSELGECTLLISAGFYKKYRAMKFVQHHEQEILADSGGFQFYHMTPGRRRQFYKMREEMYTFQERIGDYVIAGDIPVGQELDENQVREYAAITKDNVELQGKLGVEEDRFVNVVHGISPYTMGVWMRYLGDFANIGWALSAKSSGSIGMLFQLLYLVEHGYLVDGKLVHFFATANKSTLWPALWLLDKLGLSDKVRISSDSSTPFLSRYGAIYDEQGVLIPFKDIREGRRTITLYDGRVLDHIPRNTDSELAYELALTSVLHFIRNTKKNLFDAYRIDSPDVLKEVKKCGADQMLKWFKIGGTDTAWHHVSPRIPRKSNTRLSDRFFVEEGRAGKTN